MVSALPAVLPTHPTGSRGSLPFVIAHRAANDPLALERAQRLGIAAVEADLHLFGGRIEVRHLKTLGPVPLLWDRWTLAPPWTPRLRLEQVLAAMQPRTELILDLKGRDPRLPALVAATLAERPPSGPVTVCARHWPLLDLLPAGLARVPSAGTRRQLAALRSDLRRLSPDGVSVHRELLDAATVAELRRHAAVMTWPVTTPEQVRELVGWGVQGLIAEHYEPVAAALAAMGPPA